MFGWVGQLRALWDIAGQLVELRELIDELTTRIEASEKLVETVNERTRKQDYRARKDAEDTSWRSASEPRAAPVGARADLLRAARAKGLPT